MPEKKGNPLIDKAMEGKSYHLTTEGPSGVERFYFFLLNQMRREPPYGFDYGDENIYKIKDIYASTETSSYWGNIESRKGVQQEKAAQYLATVGKMLKDLFQILRELRITDERLDYYRKSYAGDEAAEMALKGIWIDLVEGGGKNPSSVFGLQSQLGFTILPDLFFKLSPKTSDDVNKETDKLAKEGINRKVREVLKRKLSQFLLWKERTYKEMDISQKFKLKYLRQHYNVIKMYLGWIRPYLRNIRKLQQQSTVRGQWGLGENYNLVTAFETAEIELELLGVRSKTEIPSHVKTTSTGDIEYKFKKYFPCVLIRFRYVTIPQLAYQQDYQRGAIHTGRTEIITEGYVLTKEQIEEYIKKQEEEDLELLAGVNNAMDALKEDLMDYLKQADEVIEEETTEEDKRPYLQKLFFSKSKKSKKTAAEPFTALFSGVGEILGSFVKVPTGKKEKEPYLSYLKISEKELAKRTIKEKKMVYMPYYVTKKAFGMITE